MKRKLLHLLYLILIIFVDQYSKYLARIKLSGDRVIVLIKDVLVLSYVENTGSAWGMFSGKTIGLFAFSLLLMAVMVFIYFKIPDDDHYIALKIIDVSIVGGAIGNAIDRIGFRYVTDFIYFKLINFPVFNIADCFISVPTAILIILIFTQYKNDDFAFLFPKKKNEGKE